MSGIYEHNGSQYYGDGREVSPTKSLDTLEREMAKRQHERPKIFVDMDGVVVSFDERAAELGVTGQELKTMAGAYRLMKPIPGAIEALHSLIGMGYVVWLATKPPTGIAWAYGDKAQWVFDHAPELKRNLIITHDKGLLGCERDYLIDDRPHKANCANFPGTLIHFKEGNQWPEILEFFRKQKGATNG